MAYDIAKSHAKATLDILQIISSGASVSIDAGTKATLDLLQIASTAATRSVRVTFRNAGSKATIDLLRIASAARGYVTFEF